MESPHRGVWIKTRPRLRHVPRFSSCQGLLKRNGIKYNYKAFLFLGITQCDNLQFAQIVSYLYKIRCKQGEEEAIEINRIELYGFLALNNIYLTK